VAGTKKKIKIQYIRIMKVVFNYVVVFKIEYELGHVIVFV